MGPSSKSKHLKGHQPKMTDRQKRKAARERRFLMTATPEQRDHYFATKEWRKRIAGRTTCEHCSRVFVVRALELGLTHLDKIQCFNAYTCPRCKRIRPWCDGAADDLPELCDRCWGEPNVAKPSLQLRDDHE